MPDSKRKPTVGLPRAVHRAVASALLIANGLPVPKPGGIETVGPETVTFALDNSRSMKPIVAPFVRSRLVVPCRFAVVVLTTVFP